MAWKTERWTYLTHCWMESTKNRLATIVISILGAYAIWSEWIVPHVEIPRILQGNLPKLPLAWAFVIILAISLLVVWEGGYRQWKNDKRLKEIAVNTSSALEKEQQQLLGDIGAKQKALEIAKTYCERLQSEITELRASPRVVPVRYGRNVHPCGLFIVNDGAPAYEVSIPHFNAGALRLETVGHFTRMVKEESEKFVQVWIEREPHDHLDGEHLAMQMFHHHIDVLDFSIRYKDGSNAWFESVCALRRDVLAEQGIRPSFVERKAIMPPQ